MATRNDDAIDGLWLNVRIDDAAFAVCVTALPEQLFLY